LGAISSCYVNLLLQVDEEGLLDIGAFDLRGREVDAIRVGDAALEVAFARGWVLPAGAELTDIARTTTERVLALHNLLLQPRVGLVLAAETRGTTAVLAHGPKVGVAWPRVEDIDGDIAYRAAVGEGLGIFAVDMVGFSRGVLQLDTTEPAAAELVVGIDTTRVLSLTRADGDLSAVLGAFDEDGVFIPSAEDGDAVVFAGLGGASFVYSWRGFATTVDLPGEATGIAAFEPIPLAPSLELRALEDEVVLRRFRMASR
jgi:hypothetical protein